VILEVYTRNCGPGQPCRLVHRNDDYQGAVPRVGEWVAISHEVPSELVREIHHSLFDPAGRIVVILDTIDPQRKYPEVKP
jgi:hypothetical protein